MEELRQLTGCMIHRGPDHVGVRLVPMGGASSGSATVGLAANRLAVRDLSAAGHMPMERGGRSLVFNGEIYNTEALRAEAERAGWTFHSSSDSEVVLAGLSLWGAAVLPRLRGMFALAFHDPGEGGSLLLARDPLGLKPLYWTTRDGTLAFASELRALRGADLLDGQIASRAVAAFLLLGSVPAPMTIYEGARMLPPGHALAVGPGGERELRPFWHPPVTEDGPAELAEASAAVRAALEDAVRSHLVSDVPLGAFLDGGPGSTALVALMRSGQEGPVRTCSLVVPDGREGDEGSAARRTAHALGTEHHECVVRMADVVDACEALFTAMDQPSIDGLHTWFMARAARQAGLTVALSGVGWNALFGTGESYARILRLRRLVSTAHRVPGAAFLAAGLLGSSQTHGWRRVGDALRRPPGLASEYLAVRGLFAPSDVESMLEPGAWERADGTRDVLGLLDQAGAGEEASPGIRLATMELRGHGSWQILRETDVMSMTHGLEVRLPFLDTPLVETVLRMPAAVRDTAAGSLLRHATADLLPPDVVRGPTAGVTLPMNEWLQEGLAECMPGGQMELPLPFRPEVLADARAMLGRGRLHWSRLWALVALRAWWAVAEGS